MNPDIIVYENQYITVKKDVSVEELTKLIREKILAGRANRVQYITHVIGFPITRADELKNFKYKSEVIFLFGTKDLNDEFTRNAFRVKLYDLSTMLFAEYNEENKDTFYDKAFKFLGHSIAFNIINVTDDFIKKELGDTYQNVWGAIAMVEPKDSEFYNLGVVSCHE